MMRLYKATITPLSRFGTPLHGDTLFGQICWALRFIRGEERLNELLSLYGKRPFLIVSDAFAVGYLPKPKMPSFMLGESPRQKKENREKLWLTLDELQKGEFAKARSDKEIGSDTKTLYTMHNSLNYKTFMTSADGRFAPYEEEELSFGSREIYLLIDETQIGKEEIKEALRFVGESGYGKNATIGKGRFECGEFIEVKITNRSQYVMSLSSFCAKKIPAIEIYGEPFVRFGKFGADRAYKKAFKRPLLLASCGSVVRFDSFFEKAYIGQAITGVSDFYTDAVHQGYAIAVPIGEAQ